MTTKERILQFVKEKGSIRAPDVVRFSGISRQAATKNLRELVAAKKLLKEGSTRSARYVLFSAKKASLFKTPSPPVL